jgi:hypothetical protein
MSPNRAIEITKSLKITTTVQTGSTTGRYACDSACEVRRTPRVEEKEKAQEKKTR